ncbi:Myb/SANT-like domain-containing protein [Dioscorea alata]|uniref:Myb/SANT-like domain-containing protein n=1 Tax=Dioscorea alata TaxID=55571 RepID=A0ACB7WSE1_DIOAL|nr:Myb/SANT-like domain-containing protein [Dioscorea alata]
MAMFLHVVGHNVRNRVVGMNFLRSGETVSRYFHHVLHAIGELRVARAVSARFNLTVSDTHVNNRLRHVRKIWLIIKKIKSLSGVSWDDVEKKIVMGEEEYQIYIQAHPGEEIYINKPIQDYDEMAIVCGNDQATGSFARTGSQSSRSLGARMDQPPTSPVIDLDNQTQGFDDFDDFAPSDNPTNDTPTTATSTARKGKKRVKHANADEEIMRDVKCELGRIANALEADKSKFISKELLDEIMTLSAHYSEYDLGRAYDYLLQNLPLANGFMNKTHSLRCIWMDDFLDRLRDDRRA